MSADHKSLFTPAVAATWKFGQIAVLESSNLVERGACAVDAVEEGIRRVELDTQDQYFVGIGGYPNAKGVMEFDAAIMDHDCNYGAVLSLAGISNPISVAKTVMTNCVHNVLTGPGAQEWAVSQGFTVDSEAVLTEQAAEAWREWKQDQDQDRGKIEETGGKPQNMKETEKKKGEVPPEGTDGNGHDTIGVIALDRSGRMACGTSTSGWKFKLPGRVGDAPIIGSGLYCDGEVGAAVATGDGEEIMKSCLAFLVVEQIRGGRTAQEACVAGIARLEQTYRRTHPSYRSSSSDSAHLAVGVQSAIPTLTCGVVAMDKYGAVGAASTLSCPAFPAAVWRLPEHSDGVETVGAASPFRIIEADRTGAAF